MRVTYLSPRFADASRPRKADMLPSSSRNPPLSRKLTEATHDIEDLRGMSRTLAIIEHLAVYPGRIIDVTNALGLPWATVHRIISQLTKANFLKRDQATKRFEIGPALWYAGT